MSLFSVDVEGDGQCPGLRSMVCFGAARIDQSFYDTERCNTHYLGFTSPIVDEWDPEALAVSGYTREQHEGFHDPETTMKNFRTWVEETNLKGRPVLITDNPAYDWQFINYYMHRYTGGNPFGFSARRIGDFAAGLERDFFASSKWKKLRVTKHTHDPRDDAIGNAEALIRLAKQHEIKLPV